MRVALPYDGSASASRALEYTVALAQRSKEPLEVDLVNAQDIGAGVGGFLGSDAADTAARLTQSALQTGRTLLTEPLAKLERAGITSRQVVLVGDPAQIVADYVERHACDAVVMGTRGLGRVTGLVLGSVASKLIYLLKVPVTLIK
jgi:nucleotide-binding universal stress UspA family protein